MKKLLTISLCYIFCLVLFRAEAQAAFAFVNTANVQNGATASGTAAIPATSLTAGNLIVVCGGSATNSATTITSISDTALNTYTRITGTNNVAVGGVEMWYAKNVTGNASNVVTVHFSGTPQFGFAVSGQYSGADVSTPSDKSATGASAGTTTTPVTAASPTTSVASEALVGCLALDSTRDLTAGSGYTIRTGTTSVDLGLEDQFVSATGAYTAGVTANTAVNWLMLLGTFEIAGSSGGSTNKMPPRVQ